MVCPDTCSCGAQELCKREHHCVNISISFSNVSSYSSVSSFSIVSRFSNTSSFSNVSSFSNISGFSPESPLGRRHSRLLIYVPCLLPKSTVVLEDTVFSQDWGHPWTSKGSKACQQTVFPIKSQINSHSSFVY